MLATLASITVAALTVGELRARCAYGQPGIAGTAIQVLARACRRRTP